MSHHDKKKQVKASASINSSKFGEDSQRGTLELPQKICANLGKEHKFNP